MFLYTSDCHSNLKLFVHVLHLTRWQLGPHEQLPVHKPPTSRISIDTTWHARRITWRGRTGHVTHISLKTIAHGQLFYNSRVAAAGNFHHPNCWVFRSKLGELRVIDASKNSWPPPELWTILWLVENRSRGMISGLWLDNTAAYTFLRGLTIIWWH
jgi:hypothetical protein